MQDLKKYRNILVLAAHPDDETIGCGGSIKKWSSLGSKVNVVFMTDGATGIDQQHSVNQHNVRSIRMDEATEASLLLGINKIKSLEIECQNIQNSKDTFHKVIKEIRNFKPDLVITHYKNDKHRDHRTTSEIVKEACWKANENIHPELGRCHKIKDLWAFEITDLLPRIDIAVDTTETHKHKVRAMKVYNSQKNVIEGILGHIDGLSKVRGYSIGKKHAEGFMRLYDVPIIN